MILARPNGKPLEPEDLKLCHLQYNGCLEDLCGSLKREGFLIHHVPTVLALRKEEYEISVTLKDLKRLRERYDVDESYDPRKPGQGLINVHGIVKANEMMGKRLEERREGCPQPVYDLYSQYLDKRSRGHRL